MSELYGETFSSCRYVANPIGRGGNRRACDSAKSGLPRDLFEQTRILVSTQELFALWRAIGDVSKDAAIGMKLATETRIERFHPMGIAVLSTESFGAATGRNVNRS
jgi:hypothetical protein